MLHPDGQYDPQIVPQLIDAIRDGSGDMVLASRFLVGGKALQGGMPIYKFVANRSLTAIENVMLGLKLSEYHSGYRAYSRELLETIPFLRNSNDFVFDQQLIFQAAHFGFKIHEIPVETRYFEGASSISFRRSVVYGLATLGLATRYLLHKGGILGCLLFRE
jgi:hypothetical protein